MTSRGSSYFSLGIAPAPFIADEDLENTQWRAVVAASGNGRVASATGACNPFPIGILTNSPSANQEATVVILGPTKARCRPNASDLQFGRLLTVASDACLEPLVTGTCPIFARYLGPNQSTAGASVLANVLVLPIQSGSTSGS